ncbi:MAG TPA: Y4yA family PLP-dependent enzyme [Patescibacteria group bacterium]|nr:Y4yA family PLP-dependent enzyme [Patescibacteria group bacterium]
MDHKLSPIIHHDVATLCKDHPNELYKIVELLGSPLHITFPGIMQDTIEHFRRTLDDAGMQDGKVHFAAKANKANSFLAASAVTGICADVASAQEMMAALNAGVPGRSIGVSGPAKPPSLLALAILHNACIAIDDPTELPLIIELAAGLPVTYPVRVYLRLSSGDNSRFGMAADDINNMLTQLVQLQTKCQLEGFSFHVSGYNSNDRVAMIRKACKAIEQAYATGLKPKHINIGGGLQTTYADANDWNLKRATDREFAGDVKPQFVYPYAAEPSGYAQLKEILEAVMPAIKATENIVGQRLMIDVEPGRSLLDQAGITIFRVRGVRAIGKRWLVMVDGSSRSLSEFWRNSEFFTDPLHITKSPRENEPFAAAIASNTCLESDYLSRRFIPFETRPIAGDLLVYINTAGYQMDSKESEFHRLPLPVKVAALKNADAWSFVSDSIISVADLLKEEQ